MKKIQLVAVVVSKRDLVLPKRNEITEKTRLNLKENGKYVKSIAKFDKTSTAANTPSTGTDRTAYATTGTTGSNTTTTNECIFVRTTWWSPVLENLDTLENPLDFFFLLKSLAKTLRFSGFLSDPEKHKCQPLKPLKSNQFSSVFIF